MTRAISFGTYVFEDTGTSFRDNFGDLVPRTSRLPGMDGGYDEFGDDAAPGEIGNVRVDIRLKVADRPALDTLIRAVRGLAGDGVQQLIVEPQVGVDQRYCMARVNSVDVAESYQQQLSITQPVSINFQVSYPRWRSVATPTGSGSVAAASGVLTDFTRTNGGEANAIPVITITATTAISAAGVKIRRMVGATIADEIEYAAALANADVLVIDAEAMSVKKNGAAAYTSAFTFDHPAWLRLLPGANTIRVILSVSETANVSVAWKDTWY